MADRRRAAPACAAIVLLAGVGTAAAGPPPGSASTPSGPPRFGLAHVDVMDLHVARLPDGGAVDREVLSADDLAERAGRAIEAGAGWDRWSLYWDLVDRDEGVRWHVPDAMVARDVAAGLQPLVILQGTPARYATGGSLAAVPPVGGGPTGRLSSALPVVSPVQASPPQGLVEAVFLDRSGRPTDDPAQGWEVNPANPWGRFVWEAVRRYRPDGDLARERRWVAGEGVRTWEIGNEPNLAHFWSGTPEQFARYLEVAYLAARWSDPHATVLHGGIAGDAGAADWFARFLDALGARSAVSDLPRRYNYYFDKTAWHWYAYPRLLSSGPAAVRTLLSGHAIPDKPIWVTELGVPVWSEHPGPCWDPASPWRATVAEQAAYVWLAAAEAIGAGIEVLVFFQAYDDCGNGPESYDAFGLVRNHAANQCWTPAAHACWRLDPETVGTPRPAHAALAVAARELADAELLWRPPRDEHGWQRLLFYQPPNRRVTVAWNEGRADQIVDLAATGAEATLHELDAGGVPRTVPVRPSGGAYRLALRGATSRNEPGTGAALMAGAPVLLVETDTMPPFRAEVAPLPMVSGPRFTVAVDAADGGTGVASFQVWVTEVSGDLPPRWWALTPEVAWPLAPLGGRVLLPFEGIVGVSYGFAAQAKDRAGNRTGMPETPQAVTRIEAEVAPTETPGAPPTRDPTVLPATSLPTAAPRTPEPTASAPAAPGPTATGGPVESERAYLPAADRRTVPRRAVSRAAR